MRKKFSYQRGHRSRVENVAIIPINGQILTVPKENILLKALEAEANLRRVTEDEEEALLITELLAAKYKSV